MNRNNTAAEYLGMKRSDRYDQLPKWGLTSEVLFDLTLTELKLYLFFVHKADRFTRKTYSYTSVQLAERCHINRKYISGAIMNLAVKNLIQIEKRATKIAATILFNSPPGLPQEQYYRGQGAKHTSTASLNCFHLKAKDLNCQFHRGIGSNLSQIQGHFAPDNGTFWDTACDKLEQATDLVNLQDSETNDGYEPDADMEEPKYGNQ